MYAGVRVGAFTFAHAYEKPSSDEADSSDKDGSLMDELKTCKRCKLGLVSTLGLIYLGFKGMQYGFHKHSSRKKNQQAWLNKWMLQPQGVVLKPNTRVEKFIFLDKKTYQQGGFTLRLDALLGSNLCFEISILP